MKKSIVILALFFFASAILPASSAIKYVDGQTNNNQPLFNPNYGNYKEVNYDYANEDEYQKRYSGKKFAPIYCNGSRAAGFSRQMSKTAYRAYVNRYRHCL